MHLSVRPSVCSTVRLSVYPSIRLNVCPFVRVSVCIPARSSVRRSPLSVCAELDGLSPLLAVRA